MKPQIPEVRTSVCHTRVVWNYTSRSWNYDTVHGMPPNEAERSPFHVSNILHARHLFSAFLSTSTNTTTLMTMFACYAEQSSIEKKKKRRKNKVHDSLVEWMKYLQCLWALESGWLIKHSFSYCNFHENMFILFFSRKHLGYWTNCLSDVPWNPFPKHFGDS